MAKVNAFGAFVEHEIKKRGISYGKLAEMMGISTANLFHYRHAVKDVDVIEALIRMATMALNSYDSEGGTGNAKNKS